MHPNHQASSARDPWTRWYAATRPSPKPPSQHRRSFENHNVHPPAPANHMRHGYAPREKGPGASKTDFEPHLHVRHVCAVGDVARLACWSCLRECSCAVSHGASDHMVQGALALTNIFVNERLSDHVRQAMRRIYIYIYIYMCKYYVFIHYIYYFFCNIFVSFYCNFIAFLWIYFIYFPICIILIYFYYLLFMF